MGRLAQRSLRALSAAAVWQVVVASAASPEVGADESLFSWALRSLAALSALLLAVQLAHYFVFGAPAEKPLAENKDPKLVFREEEGVSKLMPLHPEPKGAEAKKPLKQYKMEEVASHDTREDLWICVDGRAYDVTRYVDKHPGGFLPLLNMAGKDCTDVFANYHAVKVYKHMLPAYLVGEVSDYTVPPHVVDFRNVRQELLRSGLFETNMRYYAKFATWFAFLFTSALWLSVCTTSSWTRLLGAVVMGIFWQQLAGVGHDLGHSGVTHVFWLDHFVGSAMAAFMGISTCWWKRNHNTHHVTCNSVEHDPDIQHMPILAVTPKVFDKPFWSTYYEKWVGMDAVARFLVTKQQYVFYPIMALARFNLYAQSWILLLSKERLHYRKTEIAALLFYASWLVAVALAQPTWLMSVAWVLVSHGVGGILHIQIVISHWAMETYHNHAYNDASDEWYITQLKTTMNVDTPPLLDFVHIGLQFQIEHHLFPRVPRHNLRKVRDLVREVAKKHKLQYHEPGFFQANMETLQALADTALNAAAAEKGKSGFYESALCAGLQLAG